MFLLLRGSYLSCMFSGIKSLYNASLFSINIVRTKTQPMVTRLIFPTTALHALSSFLVTYQSLSIDRDESAYTVDSAPTRERDFDHRLPQ